MATGYTHPVKDGEVTTLEEFTLQCARNFGALIMMRDEPLSAPVPDAFTVAPWYNESIDRARRRLAELEALDAEGVERLAEESYQRELHAYDSARVARDVGLARMRAMLDRVNAWEPPTPDHDGLKAFMVDQLQTSINFEQPHPEFDRPPVRQAPGPFIAAALDDARRDLSRYQQSKREEEARIAGRNKWVAQLRASLAPNEVKA